MSDMNKIRQTLYQKQFQIHPVVVRPHHRHPLFVLYGLREYPIVFQPGFN